MKLSAALGTLIGLALAIALVVANDAAEIGRAILGVGWGVFAVVALHLPQTFFSSLGWYALVAEPQAPGRTAFFCLRWIREAVNALLPVVQIGGELVRARLLALRGVSLKMASASVTVDLTMEMASQIVFTLLGITLLLLEPQERATIHWIVSVAIITIMLGAAFVTAQRLGLFRLVERILIRLAERLGWHSLSDISGLHDAINLLYRDPRRLWSSGGYHLISWLLGTLETLAALHVLGIDVGLREALIIESLVQATRSLGFVVPGALGVQEGGYILICGLLGIGPQSAIELSLLRRIRELILGVPAMVGWHRIEARFAKRHSSARAEERSPKAACRGKTNEPQCHSSDTGAADDAH